MSVLCFSAIIFAWYVVNSLGAGLHSYGFSSTSGLAYLGGALLAQFLYVLLALGRSSAPSVAKASSLASAINEALCGAEAEAVSGQGGQIGTL